VNIRTRIFALSILCASFSVFSVPVFAKEIVYLNAEGSDIQVSDLSTSQTFVISSSEQLKYFKNSKKLQITIPKNYQGNLAWLREFQNLETLKIYDFTNSISIDFLESLSSLKEFTIYEKEKNSNLSFEAIKYSKNLRYLEINSPNSFDVRLLEELPQLEDLFLLNGTYSNLEILRSSSITSLRMSADSVPPHFFESLTHLKKLKLYIDTTTTMDYKKLTFLEELSFGNSRPYSIAINFTDDDYSFLKAHGVNITSDVEGTIEKVLEIDTKLNSIVSSMNVDKSFSDFEKLDAILITVLERLSYDLKVMELVNNHQDYRYYASRFYKDGLLYGVFENDTAICGNYASFFVALSHRVGLEAYYLENSYHAWNLVRINSSYYYVDPTFLESTYDHPEDLIRNKNRNIKWYLEDPSSIHDFMHDSVDLSMTLKRDL